MSFIKGNDIHLDGEILIEGIVNNPTTGQLDDVATADLNTIRFTAATVITGFSNSITGKVISIVNATSADINILNDSTFSSVGNRILTGSSLDVLFPKDSIIDLQYDSISAYWRVLGGSGSNVSGKNEIPSGIVDGINRYFTTSKVPITGSLIVFLNGLKLGEADYSLSGQVIELSSAPAIAQDVDVFYIASGGATIGGGSSGQFVVDYITISSTDLSNKYLVLTSVPTTPTRVVLDIPTGSPQIYGSDFSVTGSHLSWSGLGLDGDVNLGDTFRVQYFA